MKYGVVFNGEQMRRLFPGDKILDSISGGLMIRTIFIGLWFHYEFHFPVSGLKFQKYKNIFWLYHGFELFLIIIEIEHNDLKS